MYVYHYDFEENLTVLEQSEENIENAKKLKNFFKKPETEKELKDRFSKNDGLHNEDGKFQEGFLQSKDSDLNIETNKIDSKKVAEQSIGDLYRNLSSIKKDGSKYIIKSQDKVEENLRKLLGKRSIKEEDEFTKIIKNKMKVDINKLCSFPGQSTQFEVLSILERNGFSVGSTSLSYDIVINDNGTIDITARNIYKIDFEDTGCLPIAIESKTVFRLNKQEKDKYVPITPLEAQVNVYDADVLVEDNKNTGHKKPLAFRIRKKITSIDWKNDKIKK